MMEAISNPASGTSVRSPRRLAAVRGLVSADRGALAAMLARLSPETIRLRFHAPYPRVPEWALDSFFVAVGRDRGSLVAVAGGEIVGHAMYVGFGNGREAEFAAVVEDRWQSMGIGKLLLAALAAEARGRGVEVFTCYTLAENRRAARLISAVFEEVGTTVAGTQYELRAPLRSLKPVNRT
jgi:GNAT superfamily N-acetyltransferase